MNIKVNYWTKALCINLFLNNLRHTYIPHLVFDFNIERKHDAKNSTWWQHDSLTQEFYCQSLQNSGATFPSGSSFDTSTSFELLYVFFHFSLIFLLRILSVSKSQLPLPISFKKKNFFIFYFFPFIFVSWRLITLQYCSGFCHTLTWISHGVTCVPIPIPPPTSLPTPFLWVFPVQ